MSIYNELAGMDLTDKSADELNAIDNHASDALDDILIGLESVGKLMFWAPDGENYPQSTATEEIRNIGGMLSSLMPVCRALRDIADRAHAELIRTKE